MARRYGGANVGTTLNSICNTVEATQSGDRTTYPDIVMHPDVSSGNDASPPCTRLLCFCVLAAQL